tara:strand:- start:3700 stop:4491 length:792 start_codon:yes stop_codon:yes gene_type:complete
MTSLKSVDNDFWHNPPWGHGREKFRLGLRPVSHSQWFASKISNDLLNYKKDLLKTRYHDVIATTEDSKDAQDTLAKKLNIEHQNYADKVADISLSVPDDLCIIECDGNQRLLAASICSPSYWNIKNKIGKSLKAIHQPVNSLNKKIGNPIEKFIKNAPIDTPFLRENWFIHGDDHRMHLNAENFPKGPVDRWVIRSERETLYKFHKSYSLFAINVRFQKLSTILKFDDAKFGLQKSLERLDAEEVVYFGGRRKVDTILNFISD